MTTATRRSVAAIVSALVLTSPSSCGGDDPTPAASTTPVPGATAPATTASSSTSATASESELGDHDPSDPTPAAGDQVSTSTKITFEGFGPYRLGATGAELAVRKVVVDSTFCQDAWEPITSAKTLGVMLSFDRDGALQTVQVKNPMVTTDRGARMGMTLAQVERLYDGQLTYVAKMSEYGGETKFAVVTRDGREVRFVPTDADGGWLDAEPSAEVGMIQVLFASEYIPFEATGC